MGVIGDEVAQPALFDESMRFEERAARRRVPLGRTGLERAVTEQVAILVVALGAAAEASTQVLADEPAPPAAQALAGDIAAQAPAGGQPAQAPAGGQPAQAPAGGQPAQAPAGGDALTRGASPLWAARLTLRDAARVVHRARQYLGRLDRVLMDGSLAGPLWQARRNLGAAIIEAQRAVAAARWELETTAGSGPPPA